MFQNPFSFDGRIRRLEYGLTIIINTVLYFIMFGIIVATGSMLATLLYFPMLWFALSQNTKRCHDLGRSGWWQLIPFYGLFLLFEDGDRQTNEYGPSPKYPEQVGVLESETLDAHLKN